MTQLRFTSSSGEFFFDGTGSILSRFDVEYPKIGRLSLAKSWDCGVEYLSPRVGEGRITVEGYLIPARLSVKEYKRALCRICSAGGEFTLHADSMRRNVSVESLKFSSDSGFASGEAERFTLILVSADPFFEGEEEVFVGETDADGAVFFPVSFGDGVTGTLENSGSITVVNRGDIVRGFVAEFTFLSDAEALMLVSDRQEGVFSVTGSISTGAKIILDTRHGQKSVTNARGESFLNYLDKKCVFFQAYPGETKISWKVFGGDSPRVKLTFVPGYLTV